MASFTAFMLTAFVQGLSAGVQAVASRRHGEGRTSESAFPLNGGLLLALSLSVPWEIFLIWAAPSFFPFLASDPEVLAIAVPYLQVRLVAMVGVALNFAFRGFWNGTNRSGLYMQTLVVMHVSNIFLNWVLIFGNLGAPTLGAFGAGLATTISTFLGTGLYVVLGLRHARMNGFFRAIPPGRELAAMLKVSAPAGLQNTFFAAGFTALFWIIGQIGTTELAAANVLVNLSMTAILPGIGIGLATAALVGQALGRGDAADAKRWGWDGVLVAAVSMALIAFPLVLFPDPIITIFTDDPAALEAARTPLRIGGAAMALDGVGLVLLQALQGSGATRSAAIVAVGLQWGLSLPLAFITARAGFGLTPIWIINAGYRLIQAAVFAWLWQRGSWATTKV